MDVYSMTDSELEQNADSVKVVVLKALVGIGLLESQKAEEWAENYTIILRKKSFFKTLSEKWKKEKETDGLFYIVVTKVKSK